MSSSPGDSGTPSSSSRGIKSLFDHVTLHKIESGLWATRILTLFLGFNYVLGPILGSSWTDDGGANAFSKVLMANAATSALRLHQRIPRIQLTRQFFMSLLLEDSMHYFLYSLIFLYSGAITLVLMPVLLFALLHASSYTLTLLDKAGMRSNFLARSLVSLVELHSRSILRMVAFLEIFLMPMTVVFIFTGKTSIMTPFLYYRFLGLRYSSRRNPYTRTMFYELRMSLEQAASSPSFPAGARTLLYKFIGLVSRMAPMQTA